MTLFRLYFLFTAIYFCFYGSVMNRIQRLRKKNGWLSTENTIIVPFILNIKKSISEESRFSRYQKQCK